MQKYRRQILRQYLHYDELTRVRHNIEDYDADKSSKMDQVLQAMRRKQGFCTPYWSGPIYVCDLNESKDCAKLVMASFFLTVLQYQID